MTLKTSSTRVHSIAVYTYKHAYIHRYIHTYIHMSRPIPRILFDGGPVQVIINEGIKKKMFPQII